MGKIIVTEFMSLDGVIQAPGGGEDYKHAGWSFAVSRGKLGDKFKLDETIESEALLLGRITYEGFAAAWPTMKDAFADKLNSMPKYVVSSTLSKPTWNNTVVLKGDIKKEVLKLKQKLTGNIVVHGSAQLARTLLENNLVDELRIMLYPVILGSGKSLFSKTVDKIPLYLVESKTVGDGIIILIYRPAETA